MQPSVLTASSTCIAGITFSFFLPLSHNLWAPLLPCTVTLMGMVAKDMSRVAEPQGWGRAARKPVCVSCAMHWAMETSPYFLGTFPPLLEGKAPKSHPCAPPLS